MLKKYLAKIIVKNLAAVKDAQGEAVESIIAKTLMTDSTVKTGKYYEITFNASNIEEALKKANEISLNVLSNPVIESYEILECKEK